jgi:hypothetical protein
MDHTMFNKIMAMEAADLPTHDQIRILSQQKPTMSRDLHHGSKEKKYCKKEINS